MSEHFHSHGHQHHHGHHHDFNNSTLASIRWAFWLNFCFAVVELGAGFWTNSVAILSGAVHDFGDAMTIGAALYLEKKSHAQSDAQFSYGYRRLSTASAVLTGMVLVMGSVWILLESLPRLLSPETPKVDAMLGFAVIGVLVNAFGAYRMSRGKSLNEKVITWHLIEDISSWVLVFLGAAVMKFWNLPRIDSLLGIVMTLWILWNAKRNLKEGFKIFLQATPVGVDIGNIEKHLISLEPVFEVHHTHVWSIDGESHILTTHVVLKKSLDWQEITNLKALIKTNLLEKYQISEATIEFEVAGDICVDPAHSTQGITIP